MGRRQERGFESRRARRRPNQVGRSHRVIAILIDDRNFAIANHRRQIAGIDSARAQTKELNIIVGAHLQRGRQHHRQMTADLAMAAAGQQGHGFLSWIEADDAPVPCHGFES